MHTPTDNPEPQADELFQAVYTELHRLAAGQLAGERAGHTLSPTDLVHEAYIRLAPCTAGWGGRTHFLCASARAMRHILVSHARAKGRLKRGRGWRQVDLDQAGLVVDPDDGGLIDLTDALTALAAEDPAAAAVVELRYFAGAGWAEVGEATGLSADDAKEVWAYARAWLYHRLAACPPGG